MAMRKMDWDDEITPEMVRIWGYDPELFFLDQDEELLLYNVDLFPVLIELAGDERCPKQELALGILCDCARELVTRRGTRGVLALRQAWHSIPEPPAGRPQEWHRFVRRLLSYTQPTGAVDASCARRIAEDLLLGVGSRAGTVTEGSSGRPGWWRFTLETSVTEHVDVCAETGQFDYIPWYPKRPE